MKGVSELGMNKLIRNSTAEFLIFTATAGEDSIEVKVEDETVWLTQKLIAELFGKGRSTITEHLKNIFAEGELEEESVCRDFRHTGGDGKSYQTKFYNLEVLLAQIREIRLSERKFYQKITDIYATSLDYDKDSTTTKAFFARVQNKLHFAIHGHTAPELIVSRADSGKDHMGLTSWEDAPGGKIVKTDVVIAKNYLSRDELESLGRIVNAYLDLAEERAMRNIPMTMEDWAKRLDLFLEFNDREILQDGGKISAKIAQDHAHSEFEKYRIVQDRLFESDFDKIMNNGEFRIENEE